MTVEEGLDHDTPSMVCSVCGSDRVIKGPFYNPNDIYCMECGHREEGPPEVNYAPTDVEIKQERADKVQEQTTNVLNEFADVDMTDPDQAEAYLKKLRAAAGKVSKTPGASKEKAKSPRPKKNQASPAPVLDAETGMDDDLIMMGIHVYQRRGSSWQQTIHDAKGEKEYRNDNVLVFAHEHSFNESCEGHSCKQIT